MMAAVTPEEAYRAMDAITKAGFEKRQLMVNVYCTIKGVDFIPNVDFVTNAELFNKIESLIDELKEK